MRLNSTANTFYSGIQWTDFPRKARGDRAVEAQFGGRARPGPAAILCGQL